MTEAAPDAFPVTTALELTGMTVIDNARLLGGNAVIAIRFGSPEVGQRLTEIVAYGTAAVARPAR
jgi:uncharacterized protein YbjQ (UPF0145 family)